MRIRHTSTAAAVAAVFVVLAAVAAAVPRSRFALWIATGRNYCPVDSVWASGAKREARDRLRLSLERSAHVVRQDGQFVQWEIAGERYWMPAGSRILPGMLADQKSGFYESAGYGVRAGDVVLDCGANVGLYTLEALARGASLVVAVEPALDNVECLRRNLAGEIAAGRVVVYPKGVWDKDDVLPLNVQPSNTASYSVALRYRGASPGPSVELTTIDELMRDLRLERVDYISMDIEGAERAALGGGAQTIRRFHPRMAVSLEHRYDDPETIPAMVRSLWSGYRSAPGLCIEQNAGLRPAIMAFYGAP
jgi:FkbM family methyltransferase